MKFAADTAPASTALPAARPGAKADEDVRPEALAQAAKLAHDAGYPSKKVMDSVADLLARHLRPDSRR
jgi:hypothetical protein